jgi:hypothetical protein
MNNRRWLACLGLLACGALTAILSAPVVGEEPKGDADKQKAAKEASEAVAHLALVQDLTARGRKEKSPLALLAAAEVLGKIEVPFQELKEKPEVSGKAGPTGEVPPLLDRREEFDLLVADARSMAKRLVKDGTLTPAAGEAVGALADSIAFKGVRGAVGGVKRKNGWLAPGQTHTWRVDFDGRSLARVFAFSEGRSPVQVTVSNTREQVRGEDTGWNPAVGWMPEDRAGGVFLIRITNVGDYGTPYRLVSN